MINDCAYRDIVNIITDISAPTLLIIFCICQLINLHRTSDVVNINSFVYNLYRAVKFRLDALKSLCSWRKGIYRDINIIIALCICNGTYICIYAYIKIKRIMIITYNIADCNYPHYYATIILSVDLILYSEVICQ